MIKEEKNTFIGKYAKIIVVIAVICGSTSGIFGKLITAPPMAIGFWRLTFCLPFFAIPVLTKKRQQLKCLSKNNLIFSFIAGAFLFAHFFTWFSAVKLTNIASASVLAALHPIVVLVISIILFKRKVSIRAISGIILALLGGTMVAGFDYRQLATGNFVGDIFAVLAAIFMGLYFAIGDQIREKVEGTVYVFLVFLACWLCFLVGMVVTKTDFLGYAIKDYIYLLGLTYICQIGSHAMLNLCLGHVDSLYVSTWESGESVSAIIFAIIFLNQLPTSWVILGGAITIIGLLYYNYNISDKEREEDGLQS